MQFLYLSPHFDDAALSCGGLLLRHAERGERATVLTICAGTPDYEYLSSFARVQHRQWRLPVPHASPAGAKSGVAQRKRRDPIATRRAEDAEALRWLGMQGAYLDIPDVIYRRDTLGRPLVYSNRSLFGRVHPDEHALVLRIARAIQRVARKRDTSIVAPLAAGWHVDHQLTRDAARLLLQNGYRVTWYEDFPYAEKRGAVTRARKQFGAGEWQCAIFAIDMQRKIDAIRAYRSQLKSTFANARDMAQRVRAYNRLVAADEGYAERVWSYTL